MTSPHVNNSILPSELVTVEPSPKSVTLVKVMLEYDDSEKYLGGLRTHIFNNASYLSRVISNFKEPKLMTQLKLNSF